MKKAILTLFLSSFLISNVIGQIESCSHTLPHFSNNILPPSVTDIKLITEIPIVSLFQEDEPVYFKFQVSSDKEISAFTARYTLDACISGVDLTFTDDGVFPDENANDNIFTSTQSSCVFYNAFPSEILYSEHWIVLRMNFVFIDNEEENMFFKMHRFTIQDEEEFVNLNPEIYYYNDQIVYGENFINLIQPKLYNQYRIDYEADSIETIIERYWDTENTIFSVITLDDLNTNSNEGIYTNDRIYTFGFYSNNLIRHELLHKWSPAINDMELANSSSHWNNIISENSGFGSGCFNGVYESANNENDTIFWEYNPYIQKNYNNMELFLMGFLPIDSISFPINLIDGDNLECVQNFGTGLGTGYIVNGNISSITKSEFENRVQNF